MQVAFPPGPGGRGAIGHKASGAATWLANPRAPEFESPGPASPGAPAARVGYPATPATPHVCYKRDAISLHLCHFLKTLCGGWLRTWQLAIIVREISVYMRHDDPRARLSEGLCRISRTGEPRGLAMAFVETRQLLLQLPLH